MRSAAYVVKLRQISIFIENRQGTLLRISRILADAGVDLRALSVPDTVEFGIIRCLVSDEQKAVAALEQAGASCSVTDVIGISVGDTPGGLEDVLALMDQNSIFIEYLYSFARLGGPGAVIVMHVNDMDEALRVLQDNGVPLLTNADLVS